MEIAIPVKLPVFEGPLDLLLHLIEKNKVNIYDIPIGEITDQYLDYVHTMQTADLEVTSEFLVMAATLLDIKSRMLLPPQVTEEGEEIDPREELVQKLLEYKMYKYMSFELRDRQDKAEQRLFRKAAVPEEAAVCRPPVNAEELLRGITLRQLHRMFQDVLKRQEDRTDPVRSSFGNLRAEAVDLSETMHSVENFITKHKTCTFRQILSRRRGKMYCIVSFLTLLELMKVGKIEVEQEETFSDIRIRFTGKTDGESVASTEYE